jgi:hypothetical protein
MSFLSAKLPGVLTTAHFSTEEYGGKAATGDDISNKLTMSKAAHA